MERFRNVLSIYLTIGLILCGLHVETNAQNNSRAQLTGTYRLDASRSDNPRQVAAETISGVDAARREEARRDLEQKLESPDILAIDVRGSQITIGSTLAEQITFSADGSERAQTLSDGSTIRFRATLRGDALTVSTLGSQNDYTVIFKPNSDGTLRVTRRVTTDYLRQTIFAESVYEKTDEAARLDVFDNSNSTTASTGNYPSNNYPSTDNSGNNYPTNTPPNNYPTTRNYPNNTGGYPPTTTNARRGEYVVPNGTILTGTLNDTISTRHSQNNDRFRMRVTAPSQFRGAVVEGYISGINRSRRGDASRSQLTLNFERIRLANGETYDFNGFLQAIRDETGRGVKVDAEGAIKGDSATREGVKRGGIGAGLGAIIGAIAGGGKGAAIGAIIGGGAGAGSVYVTGSGDVELGSGSSITVQSSSPIVR